MVCADQERPRAACRVEDGDACRLLAALAFQQFADGVLHDVLHDVGRGVEHAAGFFHFRFVFDYGAVACGQADDFAEKLFVNAAEDVRAEHGKFVRAIRVVEVLENLFERFVVDAQMQRQFVRCAGTLLLLREMEQAGVVALIRRAEQSAQAVVNIDAILQGHQLAIRLNAPVFADAQKDDAVYGLLYGEVEFALGQAGVAQCDVTRQQVAPAFDLCQERAVYLGGAAFAFGAAGVFVERAFEYRILGKYRGDLVPLFRIVAEGAVEQP